MVLVFLSNPLRELLPIVASPSRAFSDSPEAGSEDIKATSHNNHSTIFHKAYPSSTRARIAMAFGIPMMLDAFVLDHLLDNGNGLPQGCRAACAPRCVQHLLQISLFTCKYRSCWA